MNNTIYYRGVVINRYGPEVELEDDIFAPNGDQAKQQLLLKLAAHLGKTDFNVDDYQLVLTQVANVEIKKA